MQTSSSERARAVRLGLATFAILALELSLIRWMSQQVRIFAYLNNVILMACFLGMGLGVAAGRRRPWLIHLALPSLLVLALILAYAQPLHILRIAFPDPTISLWGAEVLRGNERFAVNLAKIIGLFLLVVWVFVCAGSAVGPLFASLRPLRAYTADLIGSLAGLLAVTVAAALGTTPPVWLAFAVVPIVVLTSERRLPAGWSAGSLPASARRTGRQSGGAPLLVVSAICAAAILILAHRSVEGALFSPYNRLDIGWSTVVPGRPLALAANRDAHQLLLDLRRDNLVDPRYTPAQRRLLLQYGYMYDLPFNVSIGRRRVLVVGAGTGNDVAAALRNGYGEVVAVEIDPAIVAVGRRFHPERPYADRRVVTVVNDARAYFEQQHGTFDVICFGLLDSHAMFSSMASLRLDNYVYTVEAMRAAWSHVAPGGALSVSFSVYAGNWISDRIIAILTEATGEMPRVFSFPGSTAKTFIVTKGATRLPPPPLPFEIAPPASLSDARPTTDDWPFLYLRPHTFPTAYLIVLASVLIAAAIGARLAFGAGVYRRGFDLPLFLMGAAFLLIETRGVTDLSLLFGSTWIVNSSVFAGILVMALIANLLVETFQPRDVTLFFAGLFVTLAISYFVRPTFLLALPLIGRGIAGGLVNGLPVGFAGVIFSRLLSRSADATASLGSNLIGAIVGGCLEYLSIVTGLRLLTALALAIYGLAFVLLTAEPNQRLKDVERQLL